MMNIDTMLSFSLLLLLDLCPSVRSCLLPSLEWNPLLYYDFSPPWGLRGVRWSTPASQSPLPWERGWQEMQCLLFCVWYWPWDQLPSIPSLASAWLYVKWLCGAACVLWMPLSIRKGLFLHYPFPAFYAEAEEVGTSKVATDPARFQTGTIERKLSLSSLWPPHVGFLLSLCL